MSTFSQRLLTTRSLLQACRSGPTAAKGSPFITRKMTTSTGQKYEFLVVVPDKPGAEARAKRLEVRQKHFDGIKPFVENGSWKMGGALLHSIPNDDQPSSLDFMGSTLVCKADSVDEIKGHLSKDVYAISGVWDLEKIQIYPFKCAFRYAMD